MDPGFARQQVTLAALTRCTARPPTGDFRSMNRREFLQRARGRRRGGLAARIARMRSRRQRRRRDVRRGAVRQREPAALHRLPRAAPADLLSASRASTSASASAAGEPPHLVGEALLRHFGIAPGTRDAHAFTYLDFAAAAQTYGKVGGFAHLATLVKRLQASRPQRAAARRRRHAGRARRPRCGRKGQDMVDAQQAARRRRDDRPLGVHATAPSACKEVVDSDFAGRIEFLAQNVKTADFGDPVFQPYAMRAINGVPVAIIGQAFPVHADREPALLRRRLDVRHPGRATCRRSSTRRAARARRSWCCCRTTAWTSISKLASRVRGIDAILGGHTHDGVPAPTIVANARRPHARHQRRLATASSSAVLDLDVRGGKVADFRYRLLPVFSNLLPAGSPR